MAAPPTITVLDVAEVGDRLMVKSDTMPVLSVAFADAEPPPDTLTEFTCGEAAFAATFTVTAIAG